MYSNTVPYEADLHYFCYINIGNRFKCILKME